MWSEWAEDRLPRVVKFSGGRSSAAMSLMAARSGLLDPDRGDVVLFANTSAEHPSTYEFADLVCSELEGEHGIPCLWYEFCTVERLWGKRWRRQPQVRLVARKPATPDDDPAIPGYLSDGTVFEELVSWRSMTPGRSLRFCTRDLKIIPSIDVLAWWFGGGPGPEFAGHTEGRHLASAEQAWAAYRGKLHNKEHYLKTKAFYYSQPTSRAEQNWSDFTVAHKTGERVKADMFGGRGEPVRYETLLGLRADEPKRTLKYQFEAVMAEGAGTPKCQDRARPPGEKVAVPLAQFGWGKREVREFWDRQAYDLDLEEGLGNCVYCFMKGETLIRDIARREKDSPPAVAGSPAGIDWWVRLEREYGGVKTETDSGRFKLLGPRDSTYAEIAADPGPADTQGSLFQSDSLPCACTD